MKSILGILIISVFAGCAAVKSQNQTESQIMYNKINKENWQRAIFAGGCFWCIEEPFENIKGIKGAFSGYMGGSAKNADYKLVAAGKTKHREVVQVFYDKTTISYKELLEIFWKQIDPTDSGGQFADRGEHYKTAIYYSSESEKKIAQESKKKLEATGKFKSTIVVPILPITEFYLAEDYHQDYYKKSNEHYKRYKKGSGRLDFINKYWKKSSTDANNTKILSKETMSELKKKLTPLQFEVTQNDATEPPFRNEYWDNKKEGIYVDIVSGEPLFSSTDKFKSGTGWPSFVKPINQEEIVKKEDRQLTMIRIEARSKTADSHLGHVFSDGPKDRGGLRYCINSASLRFIAVEDMSQKGYDKYLYLFKKDD